MTTFEAIKKMTFAEMARFLNSLSRDTIQEFVCCASNCQFYQACEADENDTACRAFGPYFSVAQFLALDYEKTKLEE